MKEPKLRDFEITPHEYGLYEGTEYDQIAKQLGCVTSTTIALLVALVGLITVDSLMALGVGAVLLMVGILFSFLVMPHLVRFQRSRARSRLLTSPIAYRIKQYEEKLAAYRMTQAKAEMARREAEATWRKTQQRREAQLRKHYEYWMSLSGTEFERQLGILYREKGYRVESTPTSGDEGIDLVLRKNGKTTVVQCKSHQKPVGPAVVRELFGSMVAFRADDAILACTGGFTRGVKDFVRGKPITLISATELVRMGSKVEHESQDPTESMVGFGKTE